MVHNTKGRFADVEMSEFERDVQRAGEEFTWQEGEEAVIFYWTAVGPPATIKAVAESDRALIYKIVEVDVKHNRLNMFGVTKPKVFWKTFKDVRDVAVWPVDNLNINAHYAIFSRHHNRIKLTNLNGDELPEDIAHG
jgi:hypothetical protein